MKRVSVVAAVVLLAATMLVGVRPAFSVGATATHTIAVFGDPQEADPTAPDLSAGFQFIVPFLAQTGADAAIGLGDYSRVEDLTQAQVDDRYATFLNEYDQTGIPRGDTVWVQGNHDAISDMVRTEWAAYFGQPADLHAWGLHQVDGLNVIQLENWAPGYNGNLGYYAEGDTRNSPQANWLVSTLQSLPADAWVIVAMHVPIAESAYAYNGESARLEALFAKYGVDLVLAGHDHDYRRHMDPTGIPYITDGMAGGPPGPTSVPTPDQYDIVKFSGRDYNPEAFGYLTIQFDGKSMHVTAYAGQLGATTMRQVDSFDVSHQTNLPTVTFTSPAGGESWLTGTSQTVSFTLSSALPGGQVRVRVVDGAGAESTLATVAAPAGQTSYSVTVSLPASMTPGSACRVAVDWQADPDSSWQRLATSDPFTIAALPALTFVRPAGGESWLAGTTQTVGFTLSGALPGGQLGVCVVDGAGTETTLTTFAAAAGQTSYSVPVTLPVTVTPGSACRMNVGWQADPASGWRQLAKSNPFTLAALPTLTFASPAGGESWLAGTSQTVSWALSSALPGGQLRIRAVDGAAKQFTLTSVAATAGQTSYSVPVSLPATVTPGAACRVIVDWQADPNSGWRQLAQSNPFAMATLPTLAFVSPAGGEEWLTGTTQTVGFTLGSALPSGQLRIRAVDGAGMESTLTTVAATVGQTVYSQPVTVPAIATPGPACRVAVDWQADPASGWQRVAESNPLTMAPLPALVFASPAGRESWLVGSSHNVGFTLGGALPSGQLRIRVADGAAKRFTLRTVVAMSGQTSYSVRVTLPATLKPGAACCVDIDWQADPGSSWQQLAESKSFTVAALPAVTLAATPHSVKKGKVVTVSGVLRHRLATSKTVLIYRKVGARLTLLKRLTAASSGAFRWALRPNKSGRWVFLACYKAGAGSYWSKAVTVVVAFH